MPVTAVVTDANGNLVTEYDYDLWGNRTRIQGAQDFNLGFTGHWVIKDLVLAPLRTYNPYSGRWISRDPLGESGGVLQRAVILQMRLKQAETLKGELSGFFRETCQLVHTRKIRQIACKVLRQITRKVTAAEPTLKGPLLASHKRG
jgi:RHS repeat-associated protein